MKLALPIRGESGWGKMAGRLAIRLLSLRSEMSLRISLPGCDLKYVLL